MVPQTFSGFSFNSFNVPPPSELFASGPDPTDVAGEIIRLLNSVFNVGASRQAIGALLGLMFESDESPLEQDALHGFLVLKQAPTDHTLVFTLLYRKTDTAAQVSFHRVDLGYVLTGWGYAHQ